MLREPIKIAAMVANALERCGVRYLVGGSLASSVSGHPRSTLDIDMVVALTEECVDPLVEILGTQFHVNRESVKRAVRDRSSTNLIHEASSMKVDLFVSGGSPLDERQMDRRQRLQVSSDPDVFLYFYTPEDILLQKLKWYRMGDEQSERQWRDVLGIVVVQPSLDEDYLRDGARVLGVEDLLDRVLEQGRSS